MAKPDYKFTNDTLFKMLFVKHQDLLKMLVAELLEISIASIGRFNVENPDILPDNLGDKFCRLDINMTVDDEKVDLEVQGGARETIGNVPSITGRGSIRRL